MRVGQGVGLVGQEVAGQERAVQEGDSQERAVQEGTGQVRAVCDWSPRQTKNTHIRPITQNMTLFISYAKLKQNLGAP